MKKRFLIALSAIFLGSALMAAGMMKPPFGSHNDISFAKKLWSKMAMMGYVGKHSITTMPYIGKPPHGKVLSVIEGKIKVDGFMGDLIIKKNFRGGGLSVEDVINHPKKYLASITVMFRKKGFDPADKDWFWVKYKPNGEIMANPKGMRLAGKVAKGMPTGCISCHKAAPGGDFVYIHDRFSSM